MNKSLLSLLFLIITSYVSTAQDGQVRYEVYLTTLSHHYLDSETWIEDFNHDANDMHLVVKGSWLYVDAKSPISVRLLGVGKENTEKGLTTLHWRGVYEGKDCMVFIAIYDDGRKACNIFFNRDRIQYCLTYWFI